MKKVISAFLVFCMMAALLPLNAVALDSPASYEIPKNEFWAKISESYTNSQHVDALFDGRTAYVHNGSDRGFWLNHKDKTQKSGMWLAIDLGREHKLNGIWLEDENLNSTYAPPSAYDLYYTNVSAVYDTIKGTTAIGGYAEHWASYVEPTLSDWNLIGSFTDTGSKITFPETTARYLLIWVTANASTKCAIGEFHAYSSVEVEPFDFSIGALDSSSWTAKTWVNPSGVSFPTDVYENSASASNPPYIMVDMGEEIMLDRVVMDWQSPKGWYMPDTMDVYTSTSAAAFESSGSSAWNPAATDVLCKSSYFDANFPSVSARYFMIKAKNMGVSQLDKPTDWIVFAPVYAYGLKLGGEFYEIPSRYFDGKASVSASDTTNIQHIFDGGAGYTDDNGDDTGFWKASNFDTQSEGTWLAVDLGDTYTLEKLVFEDDGLSADVTLPTGFSVYTSNDGADYGRIKGYTQGGSASDVVNPELSAWTYAGDYALAATDKIIDLGSAEGRYVLLYVTEDAATALGIGELHFYTDEAISFTDYNSGVYSRDTWTVTGWNGDADALADGDASTQYGGATDEAEMPYIMVDLGQASRVEKVVVENAYPNIWYTPEKVNVYLSDDTEALDDKDSEAWQLVYEDAEFSGAVLEAEFAKTSGRYVMIKATELGNDMYDLPKSELYFSELYIYGEELEQYYEVPRTFFTLKTNRNSSTKLIESMLVDDGYRYLDNQGDERGYWAPNLAETQKAGAWIAVDMGKNYDIYRVLMEDDGHNANVTVPSVFDIYTSTDGTDFANIQGHTPGGTLNTINPDLSKWNKAGSFKGGTNNGAVAKFAQREARYLLIYVTGTASTSIGVGELRVFSKNEYAEPDFNAGSMATTGWSIYAWKKWSQYSTDNFIDRDLSTPYDDQMDADNIPYVMIDMKSERVINRFVMQNAQSDNWYMADGLGIYTSLDPECMTDINSSKWEMVADISRSGAVYDATFIEKSARYLLIRISRPCTDGRGKEQSWATFGEIYVYNTGETTIVPVESVSSDVNYANMQCTVSVVPAQNVYDGSVKMTVDVYDGGTKIYSGTTSKVGENNTITFSFMLPEMPVSDKTLRLCFGGNFDDERTITILGSGSLDSNFDTLRESTSVDAFKAEMENVMNTFRLDLSDLTLSAELEDAVYGELYNKRSSINAGNFADMVYGEIVCQIFKLKLTDMITSDFASRYSSVVSLELDEDSVFRKLSSNEQTAVINSVSDSFTDVESIERLFGEFVELKAFQTLSRGEMDGLINKYLSDEAAYKKYSKLSAYNKIEVAKSIETAKINSRDDVISVFEDAVEEFSSSSATSSSSGSGGGSGGGGFVSRVPSTVQSSTGNVPQSALNNCKFTDIADVLWAKYPIEYLFDKGVINGKTDTQFDPNGTVTRAEMIKMLMCLSNTAKSARVSVFDDVKASHWAHDYICDAYEMGLANGVGEGLFNPDGAISREDVAVFAYRFFKEQGKAFDIETEMSFEDADTIADYAKEAVAALSNAGVLNGFTDGTFRPSEICTRAMAAKIIYELVK